MTDAAQPILHRLVPVRIMTTAGWVSGNVHLPITRRLLEAWRSGHPFIPLTDAVVEGLPRPIPFFALHRTALQFCLVDDDQPLETLPPSARPTVQHHVTCLLAAGRIMGSLRVPKDVRLSDHVTHHEMELFVLEEARIEVRDPWSQNLVQLSDQWVVVEPRALVGISEFGPLSK